MRKYLLIIMATLLLVACGSKEAEQEVADDNDFDEEAFEEEYGEELDELFSDDEEVEVDGEMMEDTDDPMEAGNKNNNIQVFNDESGYTYLIKEWYANDDTDDDGFNYINFDDYNIKYSIALAETTEGEDVIGVFAEIENGTEYELQFNDAFLFVTDTQDQTELEHGIRINEPDTKTKFFNHANLDYGELEHLKVEILPPFRDGESELIDIGEPIEIEFDKK